MGIVKLFSHFVRRAEPGGSFFRRAGERRTFVLTTSGLLGACVRACVCRADEILPNFE